MPSPRNSKPAADERWLLDACTTELRTHRLIFMFVLCPLLGYWLPSLMLSVGLSVALNAQATAHNEQASPIWFALSTVVAFAAPLCVLAIGAWRERQRLKIADAVAGAGMTIPEPQAAMLRERVDTIWAELNAPEQRAPPRIICQPNFRVLAHAYDDPNGQTIEVSAGLASRVVADDHLAGSILRHEAAHLVYGDLPAIRRQSLAAAATVLAINVSLAICIGAALIVAILTDIGKFPLPPTLWNIVAVHLVIVLATINVTAPLLLGRYAVQRYSGFTVALTEMRADVAAGVWGDGLRAFSERLASDPTVRAPTVSDVGLAYLSPALSHFPARERAALLSSPDRLGTPKLRYFAIAIAALWVLAFHQGEEVWDTFLRCAAVAFLQALTVSMVLAAGRHGSPAAPRAASLAFGVMVAQALPLISIEGIVYLTQHLTAAIVNPGGFGSADDADYWRDTVETFQEFGKFVDQATGGGTFALAWLATALAFWAAPRIVARLKPATARPASIGLASLAGLMSLLVSYRFFQDSLYRSIRDLSFSISPSNDEGAPAAASLVSTLKSVVSRMAYDVSEALHGGPILGNEAWLRLALPDTIVLAAALTMAGLAWAARQLEQNPNGLNR
jgi:hypothetical protein